MANNAPLSPQPVMPTPNAGGSSQDMDHGLELKALWTLIKKRSLLILLMAILMEAVGALYVFRAPRLYEANAQVIIQNDVSRLLKSPDPLGSYLYSEEFFQTQIRRFNSRPVISRTIKSLGMDQWPEYVGAKDLAGIISSSIQANPIRDSRMLNLSFEGPNPEHTVQVVSSLITSFNEEFLSVRRREAKGTLSSLSKSLTQLEKEVRDAENNLKQFIDTGKMGPAERKYNTPFVQLQEIARQESLLNSELYRVEARVTRVEAAGEDEQKLLGLEDFSISRKMEIFDRELLELQRERAKQSSLRTQDSVEIRTIDGEIAAVKERRRAMVQTFISSIYNLRDQLRDSLGKIKKRKGVLQAQVQEQNSRLLEFDRLKSNLKQAQMNYQEVLIGRSRGETFRDIQLTPALMTDPPVEPNRPSRPRVLRILALCFLAGIALGIAIAVIQEYMDDSVRSVEDLENFVGINCLALIPRMKEAISHPERMSLVLKEPNAVTSEAIRSLRATMDLVAPPQPNACRVFLICSSESGEGKTTLASNLAISHAMNGRRVLLLDGDLRHPTDYSGIIETSYQSLGLSDFLSGQTSLENLSQPTRISSLEVVTSGQNSANPAELLGKKRMEEFMHWARLRHEVIIIDTPPVLAVADALVLCAFSDNALVVAKGGEIGRSEVSKTVQILQQSRIKIVGAVLNDAKGLVQRSENRYYYYSYKYS